MITEPLHRNSYEKAARNNSSHYKKHWHSDLDSNDIPITNKSRESPFKLCILTTHHTVPVAARSKVWVYDRSPAEIVGENPTGAWMFVCCECCVLWGRGLCVGLITRPEESYRVWCVIVCDLESSWMWKPWPNGAVAPPPPKKCTTHHSSNTVLLFI